MRWRILLVLLMVLVLASSVLSLSKVTIEPIKNSITLSETATYKLNITNQAQKTQRYAQPPLCSI